MNNESDKTQVLESYPDLSFKKPKIANETISKKSKNTGESFEKHSKSIRGGAGRGQGRKKGIPNKITQEMRVFWQTLCEDNQEQLTEAIKTIFKTDPAEGFKLVLQACEYFTPKIARQELTGKDGKDLITTESIVNLLVSDD